ncbi:type IV pilin protein [Bacteriovorax sp. DB6_IX]|uniref:type IV pilin protein n=1 Tax=Bacteriovorax sp. DB6_IX TaxID=1353530 RepID=UPI000389EBF2|nr:type II secretion system protein [Bacteriovorax sp. DB6_IX]EQC51350.1 prepilin-type cleavage/methylation N-terminal domain protein [Bacteriovorax sp. DB6_IX]
MKMKSSEGFTLVELMVVVAIIGILSAVAIPNFKKYQAKSKTSEAKLQLASIYSAETSLQTDFDAFGTCLGSAGFVSPTGSWDATNPTQGSTYYAIGFAAANATANGIVRSNGGATACTDLQFGVEAFKTVGGSRMEIGDLAFAIPAAANMGGGTSTTAPSVDDDGGFFIAGAIGVLVSDKNTAALADKWAIDQDKQLLQINVGY